MPAEPQGSESAIRFLRNPLLRRFLVLAGLIALGAGLYWRYAEYLSLEALAAREAAIRAFGADHPVLVIGVCLLVYVVVTALSLPGAAALTLTYGWLFKVLYGWKAGFAVAVVVVSFASTAGATLAFLISRYLLREAIRRRFGDKLARFDEALRCEGAFYLFTLRLIPAVPFFVINVVMGLTPMRVWTFWWVSQLGMLAGTVVYVWAGSEVPSLQTLAEEGTAGIFNWRIITAFVALGLFPLVVRRLLQTVRSRRPTAATADSDSDNQASVAPTASR